MQLVNPDNANRGHIYNAPRENWNGWKRVNIAGIFMTYGCHLIGMPFDFCYGSICYCTARNCNGYSDL